MARKFRFIGRQLIEGMYKIRGEEDLLNAIDKIENKRWTYGLNVRL